MTAGGEAYHGVDFSGGSRHRLKIQVSALLEGSPASVRGGLSHAELVDMIARSAGDGRRHVYLIDSAFGLPLEMLELQGVEPRWTAALEWMASFPSPRDWRRTARERSRKELRRASDRLARTPLPPANLRMFRQTWHAMVSVLRPLLGMPGVAVLPFGAVGERPAGAGAAAWREAAVWAGEGCPSSSLQAAGWPHRGYKGPSEKSRDLRRDLLARLERMEGLLIDPAAAVRAVEDEEGDVLDSLILLPAARRFARADHAAVLAREPRAAVEGWVYT